MTSIARHTKLEISWELLHKLEGEYGDSFFLLDCRAFQDNYQEFLEAFRSIYPNSNIAYSYKTNYTPRLCNYVNALGGYAEVVSSLEYELALRIGVLPQRIIFNGPYKLQADLEKVLLAGSIVNLDCMREVELVEAIARRSPANALSVGLRCNFGSDTEPVSRFGFDVEGDDLRAALEALRRVENCRVSGLHCHFSTSHKSVESYAWRTRRMLEISACAFKEDAPQFIDVGGGFFSKMSPELQEQFPVPIPTYHEYAAAIATQVAEAYPTGTGPELILEPGTAIAADVMKFVAKITATKRIRSKNFAVSSGSIYNIKPTLHTKNLPVKVYRKNPIPQLQSDSGIVDIVGYTCMEHDFLYRGYKGSVTTDDYVVFDNVGAYALVLKPPFIRLSPAVIAYDLTSSGFELVKREETFADVFSSFAF